MSKIMLRKITDVNNIMRESIHATFRLTKCFAHETIRSMSKMHTILRNLMEQSGHNPHSIFKETGVHPSTIYRFLGNPRGDLKPDTVRCIARLYRITESQLRGDVPIEGMEMPREDLTLKELLTLDEYRLINNIKAMPREDRGIIYKMAERLSEPEAYYEDSRDESDRRQTDIYPNPQLRLGESRHQNQPIKRRRPSPDASDYRANQQKPHQRA